MKNIVKITVAELKEMLLHWNYGAQPVSIQYVTEPDMNAANKKLFPEVVKIANVGGMIGYVYENSVNNQLEREAKEAEFISKPLWNGKGKRLSKALSTHVEKGNFYLTFKHQTTYKSIFLDTMNLLVYSNAFMKPYLKPYVAPKNQGVSEGKEIQHREINIENIRRLKLKKVSYVVTK